PVGAHILKCAAENIIPSTVELGGKSPNIYFSDVLKAEPEFIDKCVEGLVLAFFNQGEVCTCPSRALIQEDMYDEFMAKVIERTKSIKRGNPLDTEVQVGAQASREQFDKIMSYLDIGRQEGAEVLTGGGREEMEGEYNNGFYVQPTLLKGKNDMRVFQEEIFGPVVGVTTFKDEEEALAIANDTEFGLGAGLWTRDINRAYRMGRAIQAGRVWTNCYHQYPAHAAFGGYKKSGVGRENHKMALDHYQQTKCLLVSYDTNPPRLFLNGPAGREAIPPGRHISRQTECIPVMCVRPSYIHNRPRLVILPLCRRQARCIRQHLRGDRMTITTTGNPRDSRPIHWLFAGAMALLMSGCGG